MLPCDGPVTSAIFPFRSTPAKSFCWKFLSAPPTTTTEPSAVPLPARPLTLSVKSTRCFHDFAPAPVRESVGVAARSTSGIVKRWKYVPPSPSGSRPIALNSAATYCAASRYPEEPLYRPPRAGSARYARFAKARAPSKAVARADGDGDAAAVDGDAAAGTAAGDDGPHAASSSASRISALIRNPSPIPIGSRPRPTAADGPTRSSERYRAACAARPGRYL